MPFQKEKIFRGLLSPAQNKPYYWKTETIDEISSS